MLVNQKSYERPFYVIQREMYVILMFQMMCSVRYVHDNYSHEDILCYKTLSIKTTEEHIFQTLQNYIRDKGVD